MKQSLLSIFSGILFTILFITIGLCVSLFFKPFYYMEIDRLDISENSGYSKEEIIENYNALIDYCSPFNNKELKFPTFSSSKEALIHFEEVKRIFDSILLSGFVSFLLLIAIAYQKKKAKDYRYLRSSALITVLMPLLVAIASSIDFNKTFVLFHKIAFRNDYWIFSPETDPIITVLPEAFFFDAAILIASCVIVGSIILEVIYRRQKRINTGEISQR